MLSLFWDFFREHNKFVCVHIADSICNFLSIYYLIWLANNREIKSKMKLQLCGLWF